MDGKIIKLSDHSKPIELGKYAGSAHGLCFTGMSMSYKGEATDAIIVAANADDLGNWLTILGRDPDPEYYCQVAVFRYRDMRGKRLWK